MRARTLLVAALVAGFASPLAGQTGVAFRSDALEHCLAQGAGGACIGLGALACQEQMGPGSAGVCLGAENAWWLARIEAALGVLRLYEPEGLARVARRGTPVSDLDGVTRAFEAYRDAACGWEAAQWDGMHTGPVEMACAMRFNGQQAQWLEARMQER